MKLGAYKINNIPVNELQNVEVAELNGKQPFVVADKLPAGYKDITSIVNFDLYGRSLVGSTRGFRDWKCLQREIKQLVMEKVKDDLTTNWSKLNTEEKLVACRYLLGRINAAVFSALVTDSAKRAAIVSEYDANNRKARGSWSGGSGRMHVLRLNLFEKLGKDNALEVIGEMTRDGLFQLYEGGIEGTEEDGQIGINDFFLARKKTPYSTTGLKKRKYKIEDGSGDSIKEVADYLAGIVTEGNY